MRFQKGQFGTIGRLNRYQIGSADNGFFKNSEKTEQKFIGWFC
jgi:hypothetical protein